MLTVNNKDKMEWKSGTTVQDVLDAMGYDYSLITVSVNGKFVGDDDYDIFKIDDNSEITVFHLCHGG